MIFAEYRASATAEEIAKAAMILRGAMVRAGLVAIEGFEHFEVKPGGSDIGWTNTYELPRGGGWVVKLEGWLDQHGLVMSIQFRMLASEARPDPEVIWPLCADLPAIPDLSWRKPSLQISEFTGFSLDRRTTSPPLACFTVEVAWEAEIRLDDNPASTELIAQSVAAMLARFCALDLRSSSRGRQD